MIGRNIHTAKNNYTRFLAISRNGVKTPEDANKSSVYFQTSNERGSLARVLTMIAQEGINLSKIQSFPIPAKEWHYYFHADMEFDSPEHFQQALDKIAPLTEQLTVLGIYKKAIRIPDTNNNLTPMQPSVAKRLQHTEEYYFSRKLREIDDMNKAGARVINLGIGSPDLPRTPP